jgi:opacity protein-like surface antigen
MKKIVVSAVIAAAVALPASAAHAQVTTPGRNEPGTAVTAGHGSFYVGPYAGYIRFGKLDDLSNGAKLSLENGFFYGGQAGYSFSPNVSVVANLGYTRSKFVAKDVNGTSSNVNVSSDLGTFLYDGDVQFRLPIIASPMRNTFSPFAQLGVGQIKYSYDDQIGAGGSRNQTKFTYNVGLGADLQFAKLIGIRLMAKDYITSFDFNKYYDVNNTTKARVANNIALTAGLNFGF